MAHSAAEHYRRARKRPTSLIKALDECRRAFCIEALKRAGGNVTKAARESGINRTHLHELIVKYDIHVRPKMRGNWGDLTD